MIVARGQTTVHIAEAGEKGDPGESVTGRMLYRDPEFRKGTNGCSVYNNLPENNSVLFERIEKPADCPTTSTHCLQITTTGAASPGHGGFVQPIQSRANAVFLQKIVAKIPVGYSVYPTSNSQGTDAIDTFITPTAGTGRYETYLRKVVCGTDGQFSHGGYVFIFSDKTSTPKAPLVWQVASCTVYDLTDSEKYDDAISQAAADASAANAAIEAMNNDAIFDIAEKQSMRTQWESISGIPNTTGEPATATGGSYIRTLNTAAELTIPTDALTSAFNDLKTHLNGLALYTNVNTPGFSRAAMSAKFTAYYDSQLAVIDTIGKRQAEMQSSVNELQKDKDEMAKGIGYEDYADMISLIGVKKDKTIIDGGFIRTGLIKAEGLTAQSIKTADSGKRIEIIGDNKKISVFDDPGDNEEPSRECVIISGDKATEFIPAKLGNEYINTSTIALSIGPALKTYHTGQDLMIYNVEKTEYIAYFDFVEGSTIHIDPLIFGLKIQVSPNTPNFNEIRAVSKAEIFLYKYNQTTKLYSLVKSLGDQTIEKTSIYSGQYTIVEEMDFPSTSGYGKYALVARISSVGLVSPGTGQEETGEIYYEFSGSVKPAKITITHIEQTYSALYSNGLVSYWGGEKYFGVLQLPNNDFIRAIDGKYGFKLNQEKGLLVSTNTNISSPNWNMPMNCVMMGVVSNSGSIKSYRTCNPNLRATSKRWPNTTFLGDYIVYLKNATGGVSDYFSSPSDYTVISVNSKTDALLHSYCGTRTKSEFRVNTFTYTGQNVDAEFIFFVIDNRNWTL